MIVPRDVSDFLASRYHCGQAFRTASRWSQFITMAVAQFSGGIRLRDIAESVSAQAHRLYHLGSTKLTRFNLARMNENKLYK